MNARLMELIDVSTIETMAEQFYKLTNISHQLLDAENECIFSFGINEMKVCKLPKIEIPLFLYHQYLGSFVVWSKRSEIFNCQKYFEMLSNLIIAGVKKQFKVKIDRYFLEKRKNYIQSYKTCLLWLMRLTIMEILFCGIENARL